MSELRAELISDRAIDMYSIERKRVGVEVGV